MNQPVFIGYVSKVFFTKLFAELAHQPPFGRLVLRISQWKSPFPYHLIQ